MLKTLKRLLFPSLIALSALSVSLSAAFYSVSGLSKLFAGASFAVILMASTLEISKLVIASLLHQYWNTLNKLLKWYLTSAVVILVMITSMGIYGFLSAAYQETYKSLQVQQNKIQFLQNKSDFYEKDLIRYDNELAIILNNINSLSQAKATSIQVKYKLEDGTTGLRNTISTTELRLAQQRLSIEEASKKDVQLKRQVVADSIQSIKLKILEIENDGSTTSELGPLQYIAGLTGTSMDKIINWLLLVIIFVFDPLAVSMVLAANFAFAKAFPKQKYKENLYGEVIKKEIKNQHIWDKEESSIQEESNMLEKEEDIKEESKAKSVEAATPSSSFEEPKKNLPIETLPLSQEDGWELVYENEEEIEPEFDFLDLNKDGIIGKDEIILAKQKITQLEKLLNTNLSSWRKNKIQQEINYIKSHLDNENRKIY